MQRYFWKSILNILVSTFCNIFTVFIIIVYIISTYYYSDILYDPDYFESYIICIMLL